MHMIERVSDQTFDCGKEYHPLRIKNDLRIPMEERRAAVPCSSPPRATRKRGKQGDKPPSPIQKMLNLVFGMCKSQHAADVRAQHERRKRRRITKSVKEIHTHLNLQPPNSPIASKGEESLEIESFEEWIVRFDDETPVQQWYGDASSSGFGFDYGGLLGASSSLPPLFDSPLSVQTHEDEGIEEDDDDE
jgi:hypothetical protein